MLNLIDIEGELAKAEQSKKRHLFLFVALSIFTCLLIAILMIKSDANYLVNLLITIFFSVLYLIYLVFYFTTIRPYYNKKFSFFENVYKSELSVCKCKILGYETKKVEYNEMDFYIANIKEIGNVKDSEKTLYFVNKVELKKNETVLIKTFGKVAVSIEE